MATTVAGLVGLVGLASCDLPFGLSLPSTSDLLNGATDQLGKTHSLEFVGPFTESGKRFVMDIQLLRPESVHASGTIDGANVEIIQVGTKLWIRGVDFLLASTTDASTKQLFKSLGDRWWVSTVESAPDFSFLTDVSKVKAGLLESLVSARRDHVNVGGEDTAEVSEQGVTLNITETKPYRIVRDRIPGHAKGSDVSAADILFKNYGRSFAITAPTDAISPDDPTTMPPLYQVTSIDLTGCTHSGQDCVVAAVVKNAAGPKGSTASASVTFTMTNASGGTIGTCKVTISPDLPSGGTQTVRCTIPEGRNYSGSYQVKALASNPTYGM